MAYRISRHMRFLTRVALSFTLLACISSGARSENVEQFYKGKTISLVIGYSTGGGYDVYARTLARFLGKHIPGKPSIVPRNMPGAASRLAANYLAKVAPKDGTVIATLARNIAVGPLYSPGASFDSTDLVWLGSIVSDGTQLCITGANSPVKTWNAMLTMPMTMGVPAAGTGPDIFARLYKNLFDAKIKLVSGYPGTNEVILAIERGEVDGQCGATLSTLKAAHPDLLRDKALNLIVQAGLKKHPELPNVPLARDMTDDPVKKRILDLIMLPEGMARPFATTPGVPDDRRAALIKAFNDTMKDPDFLKEAERAKMDVSPVTAQEIDELLKQVYSTPRDVIATVAAMITK